jgi:hypothetical protein
MSGLQMPKKGGAALLQALNAEQAPSTSNEEINEEMNISSFEDTHKATKPSSSKDSNEVRKENLLEEFQETSYVSLKERVLQPANKGAITRLNLDMPEELHDWMKLYCIKHKIKIRTFVCALIEDYRKMEGEE